MRTRSYLARGQEYRSYGTVGLALFIFLPLCLLALASNVWGRVTNITSLPYTASQTGVAYSETLTIAGTRLTATGSGISIVGHDIVLFLVNDTLGFGSSGSDNAYGIQFTNTTYNIRIEGGWVIHYAPNDTISDAATCARFYGAPHDVLIHNTNMIVTGDDAHCMDSYGGGVAMYNIEVSGGQYWHNGRRYLNRCNYDGAVLRLEAAGPQGTYNIKIHGIRVWTGPGQGLVGIGRGNAPCRAIIYSCTLSVDHRNDLFPYDDGNVCHNSANPYDIHLRFVGPGTSIHDNVLRSGTGHGGSRGLMLENASGTPSSYIQVYNNDVDTHEGPNIHYGETTSQFGLRMRPIDGGEIKYLHVYNNRFVVSGDTVRTTRDYGAAPVAATYSNDVRSNRHVIIENNLFRAYAETLGGVDAEAFMFDGVNADEINRDSTFIFRNNRLESDRIIVKIGDFNFGANGIGMYQDTLSFIQPTEQDAETYHVGHLGNDWDCSNNVARDMVYENGASDTDINFATNGILELTLQRMLIVRVYGNNDLPVRGATVWAANHYGTTVLTGTSNSNGTVSGPVSYLYESLNYGDSTRFNDFVIRARKTGDSTTVTFTVTANSGPVSITLANTPGEPPDEDITPPGRINDLGSVPGEGGHGQVLMTWTAPGDDDYVGIASYYVIRYSNNPISEANWSIAPIAADPPLPMNAGTPQEYVLTGLSPGEDYYVAIKAYDDLDNASQLSNVPETLSSGIREPIPMFTEVDSLHNSAMAVSSAIESYMPIFYEFALDTVDQFSHPRVEIDLIADSTASATFDSLLDNIGYFWRCRAKALDHSDSSEWSSAVSFNLLVGVEQPLTSSDCIFPTEGTILQTNRPVFSVRYVSGITDIYYEVADNASFYEAVQSGPVQVTPNSQIDWQSPQQLRAGVVYYWRISADNLFWTAPISFSAVVDVHPYPNPFRAADGSTGVTFTNLPGDSKITISSISGNIVRQVSSVGPNDWVWDVRNDSGHAVASGVYLYMVEFPNGSASGKVMVIR